MNFGYLFDDSGNVDYEGMILEKQEILFEGCECESCDGCIYLLNDGGCSMNDMLFGGDE